MGNDEGANHKTQYKYAVGPKKLMKQINYEISKTGTSRALIILGEKIGDEVVSQYADEVTNYNSDILII